MLGDFLIDSLLLPGKPNLGILLSLGNQLHSTTATTTTTTAAAAAAATTTTIFVYPHQDLEQP